MLTKFSLHPVRLDLDKRPAAEYSVDLAAFRCAVKLIAGMPATSELGSAYDDSMDMLIAHARIIHQREDF